MNLTQSRPAYLEIEQAAGEPPRFMVEGSVPIPVDRRRALYGIVDESDRAAITPPGGRPSERWFIMYLDVSGPARDGGREAVMLWLAGLADADAGSASGRMLALECTGFARFLATQPPADERWRSRHEAALARSRRTLMHAYIDHRRLFDNTFLGVRIWQNPIDLWAMQRLVTRLRPDVIIETGTAFGGSALYFAVLLEQLNPWARVVTVDIDPLLDSNLREARAFPVFRNRVHVIQGDSVAPSTIETVGSILAGVTEARAFDTPLRVLVTLDSLHSAEHVAKELALYSQFVSPGGYVLVQDTLIDSEPRYLHWFVQRWAPGSAGGPGLAVERFLAANSDFVRDAGWRADVLSFHPGGLLQRVR